MAGGHKSNGYTTERGRLTIVGAQTTNGSRCFSPVLPGIETQADWEEHLAGVVASLLPGSYLEKRFAFQIALTMRQADRLNLYDRASTIRAMEDGEDFHYGDESSRRLLMEAGVHALKERSALATHIIELATVATNMAPEEPIAPSDGRLLLGLAFASEAKGKAAGDPHLDEPPGWTWGAVQEGLAELALATGKSVEKILLAVCKQATEQCQEALEALELGVPQLEHCLVHSGTALIQEYYSKVLNRLAKLLNMYGQAQAARLGLNIVQPIDAQANGENDDVPG
jgi:hypothetical protein